MKKRIAALLLLLAPFVAASEITWKTFDVKTGPLLSGWSDGATTGIGWSFALVKPLSPYIGVGALVEASLHGSMCCDCAEYDFAELAEGLLLNMNLPVAGGFGLVANFMALVDFQDGTAEGYYDKSIEAYDADGNRIPAWKWAKFDDDYYWETLAFRSTLGLSWRTSGKRFGLEFYPLDFVVAPGDSRFTLSLDAVFRLF